MILPSWPTTPKEEAYWQHIASKFMIPKEETYLNTGSWGSLPYAAFETMTQKLKELEGNPTRNRKCLIKGMEHARGMLANFVRAPAENIAFLPNVTVAINMVLHGLTWQPGDEILTSDQEYGAIENALHHAQKRWGVTIQKATIPIPPTSPSDIVEAFRANITKNTRLLLCSHITTRTGFITPIKALTDLAHEHGAMIAFDGAHGPGMVPLYLKDSGCDFYGGNCHKWLCAPKGTGFLYAHPKVQNKLSHTIVSWGYSLNGPKKSKEGQLTIGNRPFMWQLEHWGTRDMAGFCAVADAVAIQEEIGQHKILVRTRQLAAYARKEILAGGQAELRSPTHTEMSGAISTFFHPDLDPNRAPSELYDRYRITTPTHSTQGGIEQRVSTHTYNTFAQIDTLIEALSQLREETFRL